MTRRPRRTRIDLRLARHVLIGLAAALAILSGAMVPVARDRAASHDPAARLAHALVALKIASGGDEVGTAVDGIERAVVDIPWNDMAAPGVAAALGRIATALHHLEVRTSVSLDARLRRLMTTIDKAVTVARLTTEPPAADGVPDVSDPSAPEAPTGPEQIVPPGGG